MLQRLESSLSVLGTGAADLPERQQTIRSTIAWSHDLLDDDARVAFRRLSVFRGSFALEDGESIAETELDAIGTLVDQSLVVARQDGRLLMLETIRAFGHEQLEAAGETRQFALRHARHFLGGLEAREPLRRTNRMPEVRDWYRDEEENLRTMLDRLIEHSPGEAARAGYLLGRYLQEWGSSREARRRLTSLLADDRLDDPQRAHVLVRLATLSNRLGDVVAGGDYAQQAAALTSGGRDHALHVDALGWLTIVASRLGDHEAAVRYARESLAEAEHLDHATYLQARYDLGAALGSAGEVDEARSMLRDVVGATHAIGDVGSEAFAAYNLAELELQVGAFEDSAADFERAGRANEQFGDADMTVWTRVGRGIALACLGRRADARASILDGLDRLTASADPLDSDLGAAVGLMALASDPADARRAARLRGAGSAFMVPGSTQLDEMFEMQVSRLEAPLVAALGAAAWDDEVEAGRSMALHEAVEVARSLAGAT
jgi:tetratricopeptide (TPR) repeat protein